MRGKIKSAALIAAGVFVLLELAGWGLELFIDAHRDRRDGATDKQILSDAELSRDVRNLQNRLTLYSPWGPYIVVDTAANRLFLRSGAKTIREVVVSCGSGDILEEPGGTRRWIFDTPRGQFAVQSKLVNPTWIKPDWAFIEEGEKVPSDYGARIDNDSLGDYALGFGDGFFIHGTLYTRLLGRNVTHGCIRVGDKDLKTIFENIGIGTRIYIY